MFIFLCIISSKNKDITCINETNNDNESQGDGGFTKDNLVDLIFKYSMWCVLDKVKRVDKYRDLYIELIIYMSDNMDDTNGIRKKVDEYVDKVWEKLKLGKCEVGSEYRKNVGQITAALKLMKERDVPFPSDLCKELEFDIFTVNDVYYFYIDYFIRQLFCEKAQCYNKDSDKKKKLEFLENLGKSDATKVIEDISAAYEKLKDNKFQSLNFHIYDLKTEKRSVDSFIKDYKDKVKDDSYAIYKKSYTELYKQKSIEFCKNRKENEEAYKRPIDEMFLLTRSDYIFKDEGFKNFFLHIRDKFALRYVKRLFILNDPSYYHERFIKSLGPFFEKTDEVKLEILNVAKEKIKYLQKFDAIYDSMIRDVFYRVTKKR